MPNLKIVFLTLIVLVISSGLIGCGMLSSQEEEPEDFTTAKEGKLPEWLLLEHRSTEWEAAGPLKPKNPENDEDDEDRDVVEPELPEETTDAEPTQAAQRQEQPGQEHNVEAEDQAQEPEITQVSNKEWQRGKYTGSWLEGNPHGEGTFEHPDGGKLSGNWVKGNPDGQFTKTDPDDTTETVYFSQGQIQDGPAEDEDAAESRWWEQESSSPSGASFQLD